MALVFRVIVSLTAPKSLTKNILLEEGNVFAPTFLTQAGVVSCEKAFTHTKSNVARKIFFKGKQFI